MTKANLGHQRRRGTEKDSSWHRGTWHPPSPTAIPAPRPGGGSGKGCVWRPKWFGVACFLKLRQFWNHTFTPFPCHGRPAWYIISLYPSPHIKRRTSKIDRTNGREKKLFGNDRSKWSFEMITCCLLVCVFAILWICFKFSPSNLVKN